MESCGPFGDVCLGILKNAAKNMFFNKKRIYRKNQSRNDVFSFFNRGAISGHDDKYKTGIIGRRWAFVIDKWSIGFERQWGYLDDLWGVGTVWGMGAGYYIVGIYPWKSRDRWFKFGFDSNYYDGQHNVIMLGPIYISWMS
jgi:hypothetical protein